MGQRFLLQGAEKSCHEETVPPYNSFQINLPMIPSFFFLISLDFFFLTRACFAGIPSFYFLLFTEALVGEKNRARNAVYVCHFISEGWARKECCPFWRTELRLESQCLVPSPAIVSCWPVRVIWVPAPTGAIFGYHTTWVHVSGTLKDGFALSKTSVGSKTHVCFKRPKKPWRYDKSLTS